MARGNDATDAAAELRERYGEGAGNAEDIVRASRALNPPELKRASLKRVDDEETAKLDVEKVGKKAKLPDGAFVLDATVRGGDLVYVWADDRGAMHKGVLVGGSDQPDHVDNHLERIRKLQEEGEKARKKRAKDGDEEQEETPAEAREREQLEGQLEQTASESNLAAKSRTPAKAAEDEKK